MGFLETLFGGRNAIHPAETGFRWLTRGLGTKYLLITCADGYPVATLFGTARDSQADLLHRLDIVLGNQQECLLLGIETQEVCCKFFRLDPSEARKRLGSKQK